MIVCSLCSFRRALTEREKGRERQRGKIGEQSFARIVVYVHSGLSLLRERQR